MTNEMRIVLENVQNIGETLRTLRELREELATVLLHSSDVAAINLCEAVLSNMHTKTQSTLLSATPY
jgi:hypothetical protein